MSFITIFLTSFALAMDAFAVSVTKGITLKKINFAVAAKIALFFGLFQGAMPLIGWVLGIRFESYIKSVDHWIAFFLLTFIGIKMIFEAREGKDEESSSTLSTKELIVLSIATSIDALAIGVSFAFLNISILPIAGSIALVTFIMCFLGVLLGRTIGPIFKNYAQFIGGIILILIGFNILNEHTGIIYNLFI
ncbi:manganese efflux pump [Romboutsia weinsteinii]|uniref:Putative manganese efflux pump MntP n=1 Tax=Romboutsia weinsteinii TaxID=2020949 RepID=A0A371J9K1_9FIRM|nr:manganese efflux pump MntP family protein [Romboutsia weinsteinii]RDY29424.1 manganese efflux pump [Romboutsia weinsteinii]